MDEETRAALQEIRESLYELTEYTDEISEALGRSMGECDFANHVASAIETAPDVGWIFLVDQLNTHKSESFSGLQTSKITDASLQDRCTRRLERCHCEWLIPNEGQCS